MAKKIRTVEFQDEVVNLYLSGKSILQLSKQLHVKERTCSTILKIRGISIRKAGGGVVGNKGGGNKGGGGYDEKSLREKLETYIIVTDNGCWEWQGSRCKSGYGHVSYLGKIKRTHRIYYELLNGKIPDKLFVCHKCDNPPCLNPDHLFLGTNQDNMLDALKKGRLRTDGCPPPRKKVGHPSVARYMSGCRCDDCKKIVSEYMRDRYRNRIKPFL